MSLETYVDGPCRTFTEATPAELTGKEGYLVELTSAGAVQLLTTGVPIGVMVGKLQGGTDVNIRLLGKGGTVKVVQYSTVTCGALVRAKASDGRVQAGTAGVAIGVKLSPGSTTGATNDVIEILDLVQPVPQAVVLGNTNAEIGGLTIGATYAQAEVTALRDKAEELADDVRALKTALDAAGITT